MNKRSLAGLILINAVLLAALVVAALSPAPVQAQFGGGGQYMMIAGNATGRESQAAIYIIDLNTSRVVAVMFNGSNNKLEFIAGRNISEDAERATQNR